MKNHDPINELAAGLRGTLDSVFRRARKNPDGLLKEILLLSAEYPNCAETSLMEAISCFYRDSETAATAMVVSLAERRKGLYTVGCLKSVTLAAVRGLLSDARNPAGWEYTRFVFCVNYFKQLMGEVSALFPWIEYERAKKLRGGNYDALFLLRNMTLGVAHGPFEESGFTAEIRKRIEAMDEGIIGILKKRLPVERPRQRKGIKRIAICAGLLKHSRRGMHARLIMDYARNMAESYPDLEVLILVTNELPFRSPFYSFSMNRVSDSFRAGLDALAERIIGAEFKGRVLFENMPMRRRGWQDLDAPIQRLMQFDPDVVMHYGAKFHNESFFLRRVLFDRFPTAYFFSQMTNKVDRFNDIYLARNTEPLKGEYNKSRVRIAPPPLRTEIINAQSERASLRYDPGRVKKSPDEVTVVSVLAGPRMRAAFMKYGPDLRRRMMEVLAAPRARWVLIGPEDRDALLAVDPLFRKRHEEGKLDIVPFDENLAAFYEHCDLFLHLPHFTGGAGGLFMAAMAGLPTLCFANTDAASRVDPGCVFDVGDTEAFFARADMLIESRELRDRAGAACQEYFHDVGINDLCGKTYSALNDAIEAFNRRIEATP